MAPVQRLANKLGITLAEVVLWGTLLSFIGGLIIWIVGTSYNKGQQDFAVMYKLILVSEQIHNLDSSNKKQHEIMFAKVDSLEHGYLSNLGKIKRLDMIKQDKKAILIKDMPLSFKTKTYFNNSFLISNNNLKK